MVTQLPSPQTVSHKSLIRLLWCNMRFAYLQTAASSKQIKVFLLWTPSLKVFFFSAASTFKTSVHHLCEMKMYTEQLPSDFTQLSSFSPNIHRLEDAASHCAEQHCVTLCCTNAAGGIPFLPIATLPPPGSFYTCWGCKKEKCSASLSAVWAAAKEALMWVCTHTF